MSTSLDMPVIEFSHETRKAALQLLNRPRRPRALCAIWRSGKDLAAVRQHEALGISDEYPEFISESIAVELENQSALKAAGITDDESAIAYMNKVRPVLEALAAQVAEVKERCQADVDNLLSGVTEEFWRSL
jgi:hypothetical protein